GGGGGGAASNGSGVGGGGGGGGSSYISGLSAGTTTSSYQLGNGLVIFNYEFVSPLSSAIASPSLICSGGSSTLSAGGMTSYTWSPGSSGASSIVVSPSSTSSYTVAATSPLGCYQISVLTVTVNTLPPALSVSSSSTIICPTNTITLTASGAINYTWTGGVLNGIPFSPLTTSMYTVFAANGCGTVSATQGITVTPLPVVAIASPSTICTGNAATLTAAAATNYMWSPGILQGATVVVSPTASVVYTVTGTTSVCAGITTVALNVNPIPTVSAVSTNSSICAGSSVSLSASGALSYTWQPGGQTGSSISASPGVSTLFVVTGINSFSCTSTANQVVLVTPAPTLNLVASNTLICTGGSATLFVSGANSYNWSVPTTGASLAVNPLTSASYSVTGTNTATGCSASKAISISVYTRSISVSTSTVICLGNTITLNASGATSYTWSNGTQSSFNPVSPTISTVYQVNATTFTNNMYCTSNGSVSVTVNPLPSVIAAATRTSICRNETVTISATGATNYLWTNLMAVPSFTFKGTSIISYNYTVTGTNANGCSNTSTLTLKVNACTGMEELDALLGLQIFPNPSSAEFNINFKTLPKNMSIRIFNTLGHLVKTQEVVSEHTVVDLEKEANGVYLINFIQYDRSIQVSKIIKQ
ncbi:MAG: T9SS type A sorting domain-containing protein, partial [bacterium]|nr:T9SS type A sorting domain-containing protein [bacterium]